MKRKAIEYILVSSKFLFSYNKIKHKNASTTSPPMKSNGELESVSREIGKADKQ